MKVLFTKGQRVVFIGASNPEPGIEQTPELNKIYTIDDPYYTENGFGVIVSVVELEHVLIAQMCLRPYDDKFGDQVCKEIAEDIEWLETEIKKRELEKS